MEFLKKLIEEDISVKQKLYDFCGPQVEQSAILIKKCLQSGGKVLICGNGGSAADSQHLAAEFVSRFFLERSALPAIALTTNASTLTAIANDYSFDVVFSRQVEAFGRQDDVLWAISTSGNSKNVLKAVAAAKALGIKVIGMTGESGGEMKHAVDHLIAVPSRCTPRIQESHILLGHAICEIVERDIFPSAKKA